jgi:hypothetical protein
MMRTDRKKYCHAIEWDRRGLDSLLDLLDTLTGRDYTLQITITHIPVFSVTLLDDGF